MKKVLNIIATLALVISMLVTPAVVSAATKKPAPISKNRLINLSDSLIKEAINIGNNETSKVSDVLAKYSLNLNPNSKYETLELFTPDVSLITPYKGIILESWKARMDGLDYTIADAKNSLKKNGSNIYISIQAYGTSVSFAQLCTVTLIQNGKVIKPVSLSKDKIADTTYSWPKGAAYKAGILAAYNVNQIDINKPFTFVYGYLDHYKYEYIVDLRNYK
ncbi:hypothetical protein P4S93_13905 [Aneurinibacillus thermoaerophilus]|uniref:hypothetical protein n=1 Tax=Aneurinibacillus thermoaerophilus TaxID=143495 RepID=UPI002E23958A|nr:hypothetical protein [Aneurinibacillus thermoaerophilus]MED0761854.1 hypothetical protein [Aneurinibacillus thermoaerophilus]